METIITIFTVLSMYMNIIHNVDSKYYYNADIEDGIVKTMYVFDQNNEVLTPKMTCDFNYDEQGRLTEKTVCRWDCFDMQYKLDYKLSMTYADDHYELARCEWDVCKNTWKDSEEKIIYHLGNGHLQSVNFLRKDQFGDYHSVNHLDVLDPFEGLLLADIK